MSITSIGNNPNNGAHQLESASNRAAVQTSELTRKLEKCSAEAALRGLRELEGLAKGISPLKETIKDFQPQHLKALNEGLAEVLPVLREMFSLLSAEKSSDVTKLKLNGKVAAALAHASALVSRTAVGDFTAPFLTLTKI